MMDPVLKDRLMSALEDGVGRVNAGSDPNAALAKAAESADFNIEQTRRLCELFNTARTLNHFEKNKDCKEAAFDLADSAVVLGIMFDEPAVSDKLAEDMYDYSEYERRDPAAMEDVVDDLFGVGKQASPSRHIDNVTADAYRTYEVQRSMSNQLASESEQATELAVSLYSKVASALRQADEYGAGGNYALFTHLRKTAAGRLGPHMPVGFKPATVKFAAVVESYPVKPWLALFDRAEDLMFKAAAARALAYQVRNEAEAFRTEFENTLGGDIVKRAAKPGDPPPAPKKDWLGEIEEPGTLGFNLPGSAATPIRGTLGAGQALAGGATGAFGSISKPIIDKAQGGVSKYLDSLIGLGQEAHTINSERANATSSANLANKQREILLTELMANDPFISEADPDAVADGYATLMQLAPDLSLNKEVVRAILRQMAHSGALSTFDADSITKLEKTMREISGRLKTDKA